MNRWLAMEAKWSREHALEAANEADQLSDPDWVKRKIDRLVGHLAIIRGEFRRTEERILAQVIELQSGEELASKAARLRRDAEHWTQLADQSSARLAQAEDATLMDAADD